MCVSECRTWRERGKQAAPYTGGGFGSSSAAAGLGDQQSLLSPAVPDTGLSLQVFPASGLSQLRR